MKSRKRGYSIVEVLVSVAVLGLALGSLYDVLREGMTSVARTRAAESAPQLDTAWLQLRQDVQAAEAAPAGGESWEAAPLGLTLPGGRTVSLALRNGALVREETSGVPGRTARVRVLARPVRAFRWRRPAEGLVEVELTPARAFDADLAKAVPPRASTALWALRGAGRNGGGW